MKRTVTGYVRGMMILRELRNTICKSQYICNPILFAIPSHLQSYEGPYGRRVLEGPEGVVALTRYRGLQFSSLYLRQRASLPHVIDEGKESDPEVLGPSRS